MTRGFPKPEARPGLPLLSSSPPSVAEPTAPPARSNAREGGPRRAATSLLVGGALVATLVAMGVAVSSLSSDDRSLVSKATLPEPATAPPPAPRAQPDAIVGLARPRGLAPAALAAAEEAPPPQFQGEPPRVPEAYTGDPDGQALWERTVEEDQQTLQPDDLVPPPPRPQYDLSKLPAYQAEHLDADGNIN
ncbi:MAG: hypothetical protein EOO73_13120 [Myxococcales bacterium]|nr:MAG: hypothetical protein EOO73_13120 [Myxococcales bacterium]